MPDRAGTTVITIPPPTANGPLHVGHLSGPFLASDIAARAARARGERVLAVAGVDVAQNYIPKMARDRGLDVDALIARNRAEILEAFDRGRIHYDAFVDPQEDEYRRALAAMLADMVFDGRVPMATVTLHACADCGCTLHHSYVSGTCATCGAAAAGGSCEGCGGYTSADTLIDPVCACCGGPARPFAASVPVLPLEDFRPALEEVWRTAELPRPVRDLVARYGASEMPVIPLAYPTDWGIEGSGELAGLRLDAYVEVGLSWLYGIARAHDASASTLEECVRAWDEVHELWQFHGIDNTFFFIVFWPALFAAAGLERVPLGGLVVNEFYTLDGEKFSTSRDHAVWAHEFLADEDPATVRLYLAWDRPDRRQTDFTRESYEAFRAAVQPLLAGDGGPGGGHTVESLLPAALLPAERERGERALELVGFDAALAARSLLTLLGAGEREPGPLLTALTGAEAA
jgi:methionyl-tRNA synthetase